MHIHKEGYPISAGTAIIACGLLTAMFISIKQWNLFYYVIAVGIILFALAIISFFRIPKRKFVYGTKNIMCPADGKIVTIEEVYESEFLKENCRQISVFMSPANIHVNRYCISGKIIYAKYHKGNYFIASHPKSSLENERTSICIQTPTGDKILERQIAGALARRIVFYAEEGMEIKQNDELGFIKFGSRVDVFVPLSANIHVKLGQKVKYGTTVLATLTS